MTTYIEQLQSIFQMILAQSTFLLPYLPTIQMVGIILSLLICIAGYKIRKLCAALIGLFIGAAASAVAAFYFTNDITITIGAAILGGGIIAFIAYCIYRLGIFLLCAGLTLFFLRNMWIGQPPAITAMCAVIAVIIGFAAAFFKRIGITLVTAIGGAFAAVHLYSIRNGHPTGIAFMTCFAILAVVGFIIQSEPWKSRKQKEQEDKQRTQKEKAKRNSSNGVFSFFRNKKQSKPSRSKKGKTKTNTRTKVVYRDATAGNTGYPKNSYEDDDYRDDYDEEAAYTMEDSAHEQPTSLNNDYNDTTSSNDSDFNYAKKTVYTHPMDTQYHTKVNLTPNKYQTTKMDLNTQPKSSSIPDKETSWSQTAAPASSNQLHNSESVSEPKRTLDNSDEYDFFSVINECINSKEK